MECHGLQCGFCTPGMLMSARALLDRDPHPTDADHPRGDLRPDLPLHRLRLASSARSTGPPTTRTPSRRRSCHDRRAATRPARRCAATAGCSARRTAASCAARAASATTSSCPACSTSRCSARRSRTGASLSIDTSAAEAHPKVKAVVTGAMLAERGLAWMPTLSGDVQAVLATDKVRFQGQEVAFVVADDRYAARDALELIDVEYDVLPPVVDVRRALEPGAPADPRRRRGQDRQPLLRLGDRRRGRHRRGLRPGRGHHRAGARLPARAPRAAGDLRRGRRLRPDRREAHALVHHPGAARAPHALRRLRRASPSTASG